MPQISAFRGIRYDLGHVGSLSDVVAPPYDVIDAQLLGELYDRSEHNCARLILGMDEPGDDQHENRYSRAARFFKSWQRDGILFSEGDPAIYVYHQEFVEAGVAHTRRGFMCRTRLEPFGEGNIHPHEQTHSGAKADRLKLWQKCKANMSQIFGLYPDSDNVAQDLLERATVGITPLEATDHLGVLHRLWPVTDISVLVAASAAMGDKPVYIADGHHRYETACNYRDALAHEMGGIDPQHPANFVMMMCVSMSDPGMIVLPTHRLFRGLPPITTGLLGEKLGDYFTTTPAGKGADQALHLWEEIETEDDQATLALFTSEDQQWTVVRLTDAGRAKMAIVGKDQCPAWQGLGVSILQRLIVETLLADLPGIGSNLPAPNYVRAIEEVVDGLQSGDSVGRDHTGQVAAGGRFELAALVMPATLEHIRAISGAGQRMPAKSTYFYPKLLSGLVFNPLE
ncbi:MAG: DUF1015 domain-containing protein [Pirellulales bacterium]|nr:DUF1015 domain-containing protein [Pirellulales bacterium]